jgi:hypothetical protein
MPRRSCAKARSAARRSRRSPDTPVKPAPDGNERHDDPGVGPTGALSLRVSVATLVRVVFDAPVGGQPLVALERTATALAGGRRGEVAVVAKPFGGGVTLTDPGALREVIGAFHFASERSRRERAARLQVRPEAWERVKRICLDHLRPGETSILDPSPHRELAEELRDTLGAAIGPEDYRLRPLGMRVQDAPRPSTNVRAPGRPTVRVYYVFEARWRTRSVIRAMVENSRATSDRDLAMAALRDAQEGGRGRANGVLVLELDRLRRAILATPTEHRGAPHTVEGHRLAGNVPVVLDDAELPGYRTYEPPAS